ncbi:MAG TPA: hypothetical protein PLW35_14465, partial [Verrucomicrobiota bacterium]|nr:hypothetical protein [Verrucomicrobiota bacterium]
MHKQRACPHISIPGFFHRLRQRGSEQLSICGPRRHQGAKPKLRACHLIQLTPKGPPIVTALLTAREADTQELTK